jgi:hypothetical protein
MINFVLFNVRFVSSVSCAISDDAVIRVSFTGDLVADE